MMTLDEINDFVEIQHAHLLRCSKYKHATRDAEVNEEATITGVLLLASIAHSLVRLAAAAEARQARDQEDR